MPSFWIRKQFVNQVAQLFTVRVGSFQDRSGIVPAEDSCIQRLVVVARKRVRNQDRRQSEVSDLTETRGSRASDDQICRSVYIFHLVVEGSNKGGNPLLPISIVDELVILTPGQVDKLHRLQRESMQGSYDSFVDAVSALTATEDRDGLQSGFETKISRCGLPIDRALQTGSNRRAGNLEWFLGEVLPAFSKTQENGICEFCVNPVRLPGIAFDSWMNVGVLSKQAARIGAVEVNPPMPSTADGFQDRNRFQQVISRSTNFAAKGKTCGDRKSAASQSTVSS